MTWKPAKAEDLALVKAKKLARRVAVLCVLSFGGMAWGAANDSFLLADGSVPILEAELRAGTFRDRPRWR